MAKMGGGGEGYIYYFSGETCWRKSTGKTKKGIG
jgi:hypothetical protein